MKFDWSEYFILAKNLAGKTTPTLPTEEAKLRSSMSRAYYAVHRTAHNFLRDIEKDSNLPASGEAHTYIITKFRASSIIGRKDIGNRLNRLKINRSRADYYDEISGLSSTCDASILDASKAIASLHSLRQPPPASPTTETKK